MKLLSITAIAVLLIAGGWFLIRSMGEDPRQTSLNTHKSNFEKAPIEWVEKINDADETDSETLNIVDYVEGKDV